MAVNLSPVGGVAAQFFTNTGAVLTGGKIYTYLAGTTTPTPTYTTSAGNVARTNPIILDSAGRVPGGGEIWLTVGITYKFLLTDSNDVLIGTYDNVPSAFNTDASLVIYTPAGVNAVATTVQAKLRETFSVKDFGATGDGLTNDTIAVQNALNYLRDNGGTLVFPFGTYVVNAQLTLQRSDNSHAKRWVIEGNDSLIKSSFNGEIFVVGATDFIYFVEDGGTVINNLFINGSETTSGSSGVDPAYSQTGLYLYIAGNVNLNNVQSLKSKTGIRTHACFPLKAINVSGRGCWIGAHLDEASNLQDWDNFHAPNCRYSVLIKSTTTTFDAGKSNNITFTKWWPEGSEVGMVIDPGSASGGQPLLRSIAVIEPYISGITYDIIRMGTVYTFATPGTRGIAAADFVLDVTFRDGLWNNTYSATSSALAFDNNNRVRQVYANIPIPSLDENANSWVNSPAGGWLTVRAVPNTAYTGETRIYVYNKTGSLVQKNESNGDIEFFGSNGIKFPLAAGVYSSVLSDYEEGTFTPTIKGTTSAGAGTYTTQTGRYTKIGDRVVFDISISWSAHTGTGNMRIAALPYTPRASIFNSCAIGQFSNITLTASTYASAFVRDDATEIQLNQLLVGGGASSEVAMDGSGTIYVSGSYEVA